MNFARPVPVPLMLLALITCMTILPAAAQIQVTSANPSAAAQGTTNLNVTVNGNGFKKGAIAKWFVTGTTNPGGVTVNSTAYNSGSSVTANITISGTATLSGFDVVVTNTDGRTGKGTDLFTVTQEGTPNGNGRAQNVPVTTYVSDLNASSVDYYIQSDGLQGPVNHVSGEYDNNYQNASSILNANTFNQLPPGDWTLDLLSSTSRTMQLTLNSLNEVQPGQTGYTVPPNPPFTGTMRVVAKFAEDCTGIGLDIGTMNAVNQTLQCPAIFRFDWNSSTYYRIYMTGSWEQNAPESTLVQIQCNSLGTNGYCNDWYVDPIPISNGDGTFSPGQAIGRLVAVDAKRNVNQATEGDFYMTFHIHVTTP